MIRKTGMELDWQENKYVWNGSNPEIQVKHIHVHIKNNEHYMSNTFAKLPVVELHKMN